MLNDTDLEIFENYHQNLPFSFGSKKLVRGYTGESGNTVNKILSKSETFTEFREFKKPRYTPPIRTYRENYLWEIDLMFFTHPDFVNANDGSKYILAVIDTFTRFVHLVSLQQKNAKTVVGVMERLFNLEKPKYLRIDAGGEFLNKLFLDMCKRFQIKVYIAMEPIKCAFIERFNRTLKRILVQIMDHNKTLRWKDHLATALEIYNTRKHSSLKMSPVEATNPQNHKKILQINLKKYSKFDKLRVLKNRKHPKFKKGQIVKLFRKKNLFTRSFNKNVTKEFFEIYHIDRKLSKDRYYLKDLNGDKIIGSFYQEYLVPFSPQDNAIYDIDPNFKDFQRKTINGKPYIYVKWFGWPNKFNQWVPLKNVKDQLRHLHT